MLQQVNILAVQNQEPQFDFQSSRKGGRRENGKSCPLTSVYTCAVVCQHMYMYRVCTSAQVHTYTHLITNKQ